MSNIIWRLRDNGKNSAWPLYDEAADLIEQQQSRISELEQREAELAATVEQLREAGNNLRKPWDLSKILGAETRRPVEKWDITAEPTPSQNLNAVKREGYADGYYDGFTECHSYNFDATAECQDMALYNADEKANQRYPDKE